MRNIFFPLVCGLLLRQSSVRRRPVLVDAVRLGHRVHQDHGLPAESSSVTKTVSSGTDEIEKNRV